MRGFGLLALAAVAGIATAAAAADGGPAGTPPSLEYRPPRQVIPEPKAPHPLPPKTLFREIIGSFGMLTGSFDRPGDVARVERSEGALQEGDFYVLDVGNNRIQRFDRFGTFKETCGRRGINDGEFDSPTAIAIGTFDGNSSIYVVDAGNHRIQICDPAEMFTSSPNCDCVSRGSLGSAEPRSLDRASFKSPRDIAFDECSPTPNIYVLDSGNERVLIFDSAGKYVNRWDRSTGVTGGVFTGLASIAWSDERFGFIYTLGAGCVVQQFKPDGCSGRIGGTLINSWPAIPAESGLCVPARIEVDREYNYVYVLDAGNSHLACYNPDGLYRWTLRGAQSPFAKPLGFAVDSRGEEFLVADTESNIVQKFTLR